MTLDRPRRASLAGLLTILLLLLGMTAGTAPVSARAQFRGAQVHSLWGAYTPTEVVRELDLLQGAGANVIRLDVGWSSLEGDGRGQYSSWYLDKMDHVVQAASARGMKVIATLWETPCWASSAPAELKQGCAGSWWDRGVNRYPPSDPQDFADTARFVAERYGSKLAALEVWNEPQHDFYFTTPDKVTAYAGLLRATYPAVHPTGVPVLAGALAYVDTGFLQALYAAGIKGNYDGLSIHPYTGANPDAATSPGFGPSLQKLRWLQLSHGDSSPLWLTEFGWASCSHCVSEQQQADYTRRAWALLDAMSYVRGATIYQLRDTGVDASDAENNYGLLRQDWSPRPVWAAFKASLAGAPLPVTRPTRRAAPKSPPPRPVGPERPAHRTGASSLRPADPPAGLRVGVRRRAGWFVVTGRSAPRRPVGLTLYRARRSGKATRWVLVRRMVARTSSEGRFERRLGRVQRLRGGRVVARLSRQQRAVRLVY